MRTLREYINESNSDLSKILKDIIYNDDFQEQNYSIFDDNLSEEELRIKLIDGYCLSVVMFISDTFNIKGIKYYILTDYNDAFHYCMYYNKKVYDAFNYNGVDKLKDLKFIELNKEFQKYSEEELWDKKRMIFISEDTFDYDKAVEIEKAK